MQLLDRPFTIECQRIFRRAEDLAAELGHPAVATEHLLLAMLDVPAFASGGLAALDAGRVRAEVAVRTRHIDDADALAFLGIDLAEVRERIGGYPRAAGPLPWTDLAAQVLDDAADAALGDARAHDLPPELHIIGTDWLHLALLDRDEGIASAVLRDLGVDRAVVVAELRTWLPAVHRLRRRMLDDPTHRRYRELLAAYGRADPALRAGAADGVRELHSAHDRLIAETIERLRHGGDEAAVAGAYLRALAAPVDTAARALVRAGIVPR